MFEGRETVFWPAAVRRVTAFGYVSFCSLDSGWIQTRLIIRGRETRQGKNEKRYRDEKAH